MAEVMTKKLVLRNDFTANWDAVKDTVILLRGEAGVEYTLEGKIRVKLGDGVSTWAQLPYFGEYSSLETAVAQLEARMTVAESEIVALRSSIGPLAEGETVVALVEKAQAAAVEAAVDQILGEGVAEQFDTLKEIADYIAEDKEGAVAMLEDIAALTEQSNRLEAITKKVKFNIGDCPVGARINYKDYEIRVMCPADTTWYHQSVGPEGNANMYYMSFRAYAPADAVGFKEGLNGTVEDEYFTFDDDFAGTDEYGRKYSIVWLPLAIYDEASDTWTYYGKSSSNSRYIGWTYCAEWYDQYGVVIGSDTIRINLSNEDCHNNAVPYYVAHSIATAQISTDQLVQGEEELVIIGGSSL